MKTFKLFILSLFVILLCSCSGNKTTNNDNKDLSNDISSNAEKIGELEKQLSDLKLDVDTLNNDLNNKNDNEDDYNELKEKYNKISSENKDLKNKINNLNTLVDNINKQNTSDIIYITFVGKGVLRTQFSSSSIVYDSKIITKAFNKNYDISSQLHPAFSKTGFLDGSCNNRCWLEDLNNTTCIDFTNYKFDKNITLYSICLNETSNDIGEQ